MKVRNKLNPHSKKTFDTLKIDCPEFLDNAKAELDESGEYYLKFEIDHPSVDNDSSVFFNADDEMFTVGFDQHHCHFYVFEKLNFKTELQDAIQTIQHIIGNEWVLIKCLKEGQFRSSFLLDYAEVNSSEIVKHKWMDADSTKVVIVSWNGDLDAEFSV